MWIYQLIMMDGHDFYFCTTNLKTDDYPILLQGHFIWFQEDNVYTGLRLIFLQSSGFCKPGQTNTQQSNEDWFLKALTAEIGERIVHKEQNIILSIKTSLHPGVSTEIRHVLNILEEVASTNILTSTKYHLYPHYVPIKLKNIFEFQILVSSRLFCAKCTIFDGLAQIF